MNDSDMSAQEQNLKCEENVNHDTYSYNVQ